MLCGGIFENSSGTESAVSTHKGGDPLFGERRGEFRPAGIGEKPVIVGVHVDESRATTLSVQSKTNASAGMS